ncbi:pectate lyase [Flavobacterium azooxidireducens]|uniref:Pectate lyase n=1 Tax=Flavobacterium azooxidireducens TaxID=1871076 RepID=A0ABY4KGI6_9FLAO|nr:pectate lyase [Flavobacterium azooxidireducens]UPQ78833.1 pectate lyase [Flavobacterium azooxidireducens]
MKNLKYNLVLLLLLISFDNFAQDKKITWKSITENNDESWFATEEAKKIAENVLLYQREIGGWPKNIEIQNELSEKEKQDLKKLKSDPTGCTIDNGATCQELLFLSKVYKSNPDERYKMAFLKGVIYLITAQYKNGGWPQFYPLKEGYYTHITYNDNAMVNVLKLLKEVKSKSDFYSISVPDEIAKMAESSFNKGIDCILKTQYKQSGRLTAWCAQHDRETLQPAKARAYELPSLSGKESAKIVLLLMSIENPSTEVITAINSAVNWFEKTKITGIKIETISTGKKDEQDRIVVESPDAEPLWARFMEMNDNRPFFCDRNGKKKYNLSEISQERRMGYGWYTNEPKEVLKKYSNWKKSLN